MKRLLLYIVTSFLLVSCFVKEDFMIPVGEDGFVVYVASGAPETKATVTDLGTIAGEVEMNENYIETLDLFFYRSDAAQNADAVYHRFVVVGENDIYQVSEVVEESLLQTIFGSLVDGTMSEVYVVANLYNTVSGNKESKFTGTESRETLRTTVITSDFSRVDDNHTGGIKERSFVMEGGSTITLVKSGGHYFVSGSVALYRTAAKVRLEITVPDDVNFQVDGSHGVTDGNGFVWKAKPELMQVMLVRGANKGIVFSTNYDNNIYSYDFSDSDIFYGTEELTRWADYGHAMAETGRKVVGTDESSGNDLYGTKYEHEVPFYSYPTQDWKSTPANEAYLMLMLPWIRESKPSGETEPYLYTNTYYQIPIPQKDTDPTHLLKSNRYYRMEVTVGILGSFHIEDVVTLSPNTFIIYGWDINGKADPTESNVSMSQTSYLAVSDNEVTMANIPTGSIEYASSHEVDAQLTKLEFYSYYDSYIGANTARGDRMLYIVYEKQDNGTWNRTVTNASDGGTVTSGNNYTRTNAGNPFTSSGNYLGFPFGGYTLTATNGKVTLIHNIPANQYVSAKITVELTNSKITDPEIITFTQTPAIYITGQLSTAGVYVRGTGAPNRDYTYVYDDTGRTSIGAVQSRSGVSGTKSGNNNRHQYTLHVSSLSGDNYIIGDPRTELTLNNLTRPNNGLYYNGSKYYGTSQTIDDRMIAPEFMVASSYGKTTAVSYVNAQKRCASYQENGYPAGRWRLPTEGEIQFVIDRSAGNVIPQLFNGNYWASSGRQYSSTSNRFVNSTSDTYVRCVYDIWYWGDEHTAGETFTWGNR